MSSSTSPHGWSEPAARWQLLILWAGVLAGPLLFLFALQANYVLSYVSCERGSAWFLHAVTISAMAIVAVIGVRCWAAGSAGRLSDRAWVRWMGCAGAAMSLWSVIAIAALDVPVLVLARCQ